MMRNFVMTCAIFFTLTLAICKGQTQPTAMLTNTYFGDINRDGLDDIIYFRKDSICVMKADCGNTRILKQIFPFNIQRLIVGQFLPYEADQIILLTEKNQLITYLHADGEKKLSKWFIQENFIHEDDKIIIGDFTGNGSQDILVFTPREGKLSLRVLNTTKTQFITHPRFSIGEIKNIELSDKSILVGQFGHDTLTDDLLIVNKEGLICRFDCLQIHDSITFKWIFKAELPFNKSTFIDVGNVDGGCFDEILVVKNRAYKFYSATFEKGYLKEVKDICPGDLKPYKYFQPVFGKFSHTTHRYNENRDGIMLIHPKYKLMAYMQPRYNVDKKKKTYLWDYTQFGPHQRVLYTSNYFHAK